MNKFCFENCKYIETCRLTEEQTKVCKLRGDLWVEPDGKIFGMTTAQICAKLEEELAHCEYDRREINAERISVIHENVMLDRENAEMKAANEALKVFISGQESENAELKKQIDLAIDRLYWAWSDADDDHSASAKGKIEKALSILRMAAKGCKE
jgi:hypothetical protein